MGFGYLLMGFLFLINPVIHILDILPDCIGYWLIAMGLRKTSLFIGHLDTARGHFWKLALVDLAKVFSIGFWPYVSDTAMLLLAFIFSLVELLFFIPAIISLSEGMNYAGMWYQGESVYAKKYKKIKVRQPDGLILKEKKPTAELGTKWRNFSIGFMVLRCAASVAPELTALQLFNNLGAVHAGAIDYSYYKPFLYVVLGLTVMITGLVWYVRTYRYWNGIRRDTIFTEQLRQKYEKDILSNDNLMCALRMKRVTVCFAAAAITSVFVVFDGVNVMTGAISSAFLVAAACMMGKDIKLAYISVPISLCRAALALWNLVLQFRYFAEYEVEAVLWFEDANEKYYFMAATEAAECVAAAAAMLVFLVAFTKAIRLHLAQTGIQTENAQYSKQNRDREVFRLIGSRLLLNGILAICNYGTAFAYPYALVNVDMMNIICVVVTCIWIAQTVTTVNLTNSQVYNRMAGDY